MSGSRRFGLLVGAVMAACSAACAQDGRQAVAKAGACLQSQRALSSDREQLLELAFTTATAIPTQPHIKDRSRAQEAVAEVALEMEQPQRALGYLQRIDNWRRGAGYADLAFYCAQRGHTEDAKRYAARAQQIAAAEEDWRRDTILVTVAKTQAWLGQADQADRLARGVVDSEAGKLAGVKARLATLAAFDEQMVALRARLASHSFDLVKNALESATELFNRFYDDPGRRGLVEDTIRTNWDPLPAYFQIDLLARLAGFALDHADHAKAVELTDGIQRLIDGHSWPLEYRIPLVARLAQLRARAGDVEQARAEADAVRALFDAQGREIVNIYRAGALRPLAEAYHTLGDDAAALTVFKRAIEEGVENPNSRPRAEDLSATCASMARLGVQPDAELWARIRQITQGLGTPW